MTETAKFLLGTLLTLGVDPLTAQILYAPGGTVGNISGSNVGIGTATPITKLQVTADNAGLWDTGQIIATGATNANKKLSLGFDTTNNIGFIQPLISGDNYYALALNPHGGNVGIGTVSPTGRLDIQGGSASNTYTAPADQADLRVLSSNNRGYDGGIIEIGGSEGATGYIKTEAYNNNAGAMTFGTRRGAFDAVMQPSMTLDPSGNVGIGTTNPGDYRLAVVGKIRAQEIVVDTGWSDYVFKPGYKLASLGEVERAIKKDGHLPGIPSAQAVAAHGISLGEMQAKLLAKIEELTLHQIEQEKAITSLRRANAKLQTRVDEWELRQP